MAASYGDAELRVRPWLERAPGQFFLATKTGERPGRRARAELERSLERLGVDHVDLWQFHNLVDPIDWDTALSPGGALEAAVAAREEGLARFIGVTGHGQQVAATHRRSLERFDFDSVLLPYNYVIMRNDYYATNFEALLAHLCRAQRGRADHKVDAPPRPGRDRPHTRTPWYAPLEEPGTSTSPCGGPGPARRLPQQHGRRRPAAPVPGRGGTLHRPPERRGDAGPAGPSPHRAALRLDRPLR